MRMSMYLDESSTGELFTLVGELRKLIMPSLLFDLQLSLQLLYFSFQLFVFLLQVFSIPKSKEEAPHN